MPHANRIAWLKALPPKLLDEVLASAWWYTSRSEQREPAGDWTIWLLLAGRGFGKSRTVCETLVDWIEQYPRDTSGYPTEWALLGETLADTRSVLLDGPSGVINVLNRRGIAHKRINWPKPMVTLATGQIIHGLGADDVDVGRGLNLAGLGIDELCKIKDAMQLWREGLFPALRTRVPGGHKPRVVVATTPRPTPLIIDWVNRTDGSVHITRGTTFDNAVNLAPEALAEFRRQYDGTRAGRQELLGELLMDMDGALWSNTLLDDYRVKEAPELVRTVIAMDPAMTASDKSDETGLVAVGLGEDDHQYVIGDWSGKFAGVDAARRAWLMWSEYGATHLGYEPHGGREWIKSVLEDQWTVMQEEGILPAGHAPLIKVDGNVGKRSRAEPIAARYERGAVHHVGVHAELEAQMTSWEPDDKRAKSPDRVDALVYACTMLGGGSRRVEVQRPTAVTSIRRPGRDGARSGLMVTPGQPVRVVA